jgi:hypothetical protein
MQFVTVVSCGSRIASLSRAEGSGTLSGQNTACRATGIIKRPLRGNLLRDRKQP